MEVVGFRQLLVDGIVWLWTIKDVLMLGVLLLVYNLLIYISLVAYAGSIIQEYSY